MKVYIVGKDAKAYHYEGDKLENFKLVRSFGTFMNEGRSFHGERVFLRKKDGFIPVIKVMDINLTKDYYYLPKDVKSMNNNYSSFVGGEFYKRTRNYAFQYANPYQESPITEYKNSYPQYSSAIGDVLQNVVNGIKNQKEFSEEDIKQFYVDSKSKLNFEDWLNSKEGKDTVNLALSLINKDGKNVTKEEIESMLDENNKDDSFKILGLHPLTFGIVSIGVLVAGMITITLVRNRKK